LVPSLFFRNGAHSSGSNVLAGDAEQDEQGGFLFSWQSDQSLGEFNLVYRW
jgi:hypothetical protein